MRYIKFLRLLFWLAILTFCAQVFAQPTFHLPFLEQEYEQFKFCTVPLKKLRIEHVQDLLKKLKVQFPQQFQFEEIGKSIERRSIFLVRMGKGTTKALLWSQMHGNEPTATAALFDVFYYLLKNKDRPIVQNILDNLTILAVPMLNPDGAAQFKRRNAQGLDINRDARDRQTPEGQLLFQLQKKYQPEFGFNLHDQNARRTVGKTNKLVAISLMAPPFDFNENDNPVRLRAKKIVSVIYEALGPYLYGHISKYDAEYMPRAFGDSMQNWGVSTVLIESGGWYSARDAFLQKMNFIALLSVFNAIANKSYEQANPAIYDLLSENDKNLYDLIIQDVTVLNGTGIPPFKTDVAINYDKKNIGSIADIGDMNFFAAKDTIVGNHFYLTPGLITLLHDNFLEEKKIDTHLHNLLKNGFTTILISVPKEQMFKIEVVKQIVKNNQLPVNVSGILYLDKTFYSPGETLEIRNVFGNGMMGFLAKDSSIIKIPQLKPLKKPAVILANVNLTKRLDSLNTENIKRLTSAQAAQWKIPKRGQIKIGQIADLVLFSIDDQFKPIVETILIKGHPVWQNGNRINISVEGEYW